MMVMFQVFGENDIPIELPELEENEPPIPLSQNEKFLKLKRVLEEKVILLILLWILHGITHRFTSADNEDEIFDEKTKYWLPVDLYIWN